MTFIVLFIAGALVAAAFDWAAAYSANVYRMDTNKKRRQATLVAFAFHGPWVALAFPLFLGGGLERVLVAMGIERNVAGILALPAFGVVGGLAILLVGRIPAVREAKAETAADMTRANERSWSAYGRALGFSKNTRPENLK
jgi:hypothetical protein